MGFDEQPVLHRLWRAGQVSTGQVAEASLSDLTKPQSNWSGLGFCPSQKKCFRADTVTRVLLLSWALQMGRAQRATRPQGSIIYLCTECATCSACLIRGHCCCWKDSHFISSHPLIFSGLCPSIRLSRKPRLKPAVASEGRLRGTKGDLPPWEGDLWHGGHGWAVVSF